MKMMIFNYKTMSHIFKIKVQTFKLVQELQVSSIYVKNQ
jgi:hypothetical protein